MGWFYGNKTLLSLVEDLILIGTYCQFFILEEKNLLTSHFVIIPSTCFAKLPVISLWEGCLIGLHMMKK